ncbi:MAG: hypothetical protein Q8O67_21275 [Deltaproteobacteria bacterium]|nr:hypothetical protein [Deltaproteobacteria bacterium]
MKKISLGISAVSMAAALTSGCVFQLGKQVERQGAPGERAAIRDFDVSEDDVAADEPADDAVVGVDDDSAPAPLPPWDTTRLFTGARDGRIVGTIGPSSNLDLPTDIVHVFDDGYFTEVAVFALRSDGQRVMLMLNVDSADGDGFFKPGIGKRMSTGFTTAGNVTALACQGPDSGDRAQPFADTPFDEEPCEIGVDTEQDPGDPQALLVTVQATFADENGDCPDAPGGDLGDGDAGVEDLPDLDGDGDGDLPGCNDDDAPTPGDPGTPNPDDGAGGDNFHPLASSSFTMTR